MHTREYLIFSIDGLVVIKRPDYWLLHKIGKQVCKLEIIYCERIWS